MNAEALPSDLLTLQDYDLIILNDVPADAVAEASQRALAAHVAEVGCGLIMVGGRSSFGTGGWSGTPIEPLLPVHLDLSERLVERRTAIVFVLDRSGSMGANVGGTLRSQQAIANEAAASAASTLGPRDLVGVVAFSSGAQWVVDLAENDDPARTAEAINAISSGGGTNLVPALQLAAEALEPVEAAVKHVIVLSDGRSQNADLLPEIAAEMADAGINVSTISVGDGADAESMFLVAERGGGVHYAVTNPSVLPRVFVRAVRTVRDPLIKEGEIVPVVLPGSAASPVPRGLSGWPVLGGVVLTRFRDDPTVVSVLSTAENEPLLAHWNAELGRVGVFTSDAGEWAQGWLRWGGFRPFWSQFARAMSRPPSEQGMELTTEVVAGRMRTSLLALNADGDTIDGLDVEATVYAPDGSSRVVRLEQVGPGEYESNIAADQQGTYVAVVRPSRDSARLAPVIGGATSGASLEYQSLEPNTALVRRLAELGGGRVLDLADPLGAALFDRSDITPRRAESPLLLPLLIASVVLMLLDIAIRRIAWDRFLEERPAMGHERAVAAGQASSLRDRIKRERAVSTAAPVSALSEADAQAVADAAKRRRMQARTGAPQSEAGESGPVSVVEDASGSEATEDSGGLLAAKRRARDRFGSE